MSEHTKEPWATNGVRVESANEHGWANDGWIIFDALGPDAEANAHRVVACVNACAGIPIEMLEAMPSGPASLLPMYARLEQQRDELLAALERTEIFVRRTYIYQEGKPDRHDTLEDIKATIAKVKP